MKKSWVGKSYKPFPTDRKGGWGGYVDRFLVFHDDGSGRYTSKIICTADEARLRRNVGSVWKRVGCVSADREEEDVEVFVRGVRRS